MFLEYPCLGLPQIWPPLPGPIIKTIILEDFDNHPYKKFIEK